MNRNARRRAIALSRKSMPNSVSSGRNSVTGLPWRSALFASAATGALALGMPSTAQAGPNACDIAINVATCEGDQSAGITNQGPTPDFVSPDVDTLNVNNLNQTIAPADGTNGILFESVTGDVIINSDTGSFGIVTTNAVGIDANSNDDGDVSVTSTGDIMTTGTDAGGISIYAGAGEGSATVRSTGDITTSGENSDGILAIGFGAGVASNADVSDVSITSTGDITTTGDDSRGIAAFGLGAGDAVVTSTGDITTTGNQSVGVTAFNFAGDGNVNINSTGNISTMGVESHGIQGTNTGNNDGYLSITSDGNITTTDDDANGIFALGGQGDGNIMITSSGDIMTSGDGLVGPNATDSGANGIYVRDYNGVGDITVTSTGDISTAGTGNLRSATGPDGIAVRKSEGVGNIVVTSTGNISTAGTTSDAISVNDDGSTGSVLVVSNGNITTTGDVANGILASDADSGDVSVLSDGDISTAGVNSYGISATNDDEGNVFVTSNGNITTSGDSGRGISGTNSGTGNVTITSTGNISTLGNLVNYGIFASGSAATGNVTVTSSGNISTSGQFSNGILANHFGGGDILITSTGNIITTGIAGIAIGSYADGIRAQTTNGNVQIDSVGNISTLEIESEAIFVDTGSGDITISSTGDLSTMSDRSIGIATYSNSGDITITSNGNIATAGSESIGILATSYSGDITINSSGNISTQGDNSEGIDAEVVEDGNIDIISNGNIMTNGDGSEGIDVDLEGDGEINITSTGNITTQGDASEGIDADHEGTGNLNVMSAGSIFTMDDDSVGIELGHEGSGDVNVTVSGSIMTAGQEAYGIYIDHDGNGDITITSSADITTSGTGASAIFADNDDDSDITITSTGDVFVGAENTDGIVLSSEGGNIELTVTGDVTTPGVDSDAIDINNPDGDGSSTITIEADSIVTGGSDTGDGLDFAGGDTNTVFNFGTITTLGENAIDGGDGDEIIDNSGTITGNVDLEEGDNAFLNRIGGAFNAGMNVNIGAGNIFENSGTFSPGGLGAIQTTMLIGEFVQTSDGIFQVDFDVAGGEADLLEISESADLDGFVQIQAFNVSALQQQQTILTATGGVTDNGLMLSPDLNPALQAELLINPDNVQLTVNVDFAADGLNQNQTNIAENLNANVGVDELFPVTNGLLATNGFEEFADALDQLSPEIYLQSENLTLFAAEEFTNNLFSCGSIIPGDGFGREGECGWWRAGGRNFDKDATPDLLGYSAETYSLSVGRQFEITQDWFGGVAFGYDREILDTDAVASSDGDRFQLGSVIKYQSGPLLLAGAITGGTTRYETTRNINFGGLNTAASSEHDVNYVSGQLRAAWLQAQDNWYVKPLVDVNLTYLDRESVNETGADASNLSVNGGDDLFLSVTPALEIGNSIVASNGTSIRSFVKAGASFYEDNNHELLARFSAAPAGSPTFAINTGFDDIVGDVEAGFEMLSNNGATLNVAYQGRFSEDITQHGITVKGSIRF